MNGLRELEDFRRTARAAEALERAAGAAAKPALMAHAERAAARAGLPWERAAIWAAAALGTDTVDEATLDAAGLPAETTRHGAAVAEHDGETAVEYAGRIAAATEPEVLSAALAKVEAGDDTVLPGARAERDEAVRVLKEALGAWAAGRDGEPPPAGGMIDDKPRAPGLHGALSRLAFHLRRVEESLGEMQKGPGGASWGFIERLDGPDVDRTVEAAVRLALLTAAITMELAAGTGVAPTDEEVAAIDGQGWTERGSKMNRVAEITAAAAAIAMRAEAGGQTGTSGATRH